MLVEDYFDFLSPDDIRVKGTRIGIETILYAFIHQCRTPEEILQSYPTLTLEQIYATILYYLRNQNEVNIYLNEWLEWSHQVREEQKRNPPAFIERLQKLKAERDKMQGLNEPSIFVR